MGSVTTFGEILESADRLALDEQETLMEVLHRRIAERRRAELAKEIQNAQEEFRQGTCKPATPSELMREILS
jgi:hypothetical protein